jgi:DNA-binding MarR family transcriptional regulator
VGYLESTDQKAVIVKGNSRVRIQDTRGRITGFEDGDFISEIEDVHLMFNIFGIRIFYVPRDTELTLVMEEDAEEYQLLNIMPHQGSQRSFKINGSEGKVSMNLGEDGNSFSISTENEYIRYWVKMEYETPQNTMDFSLNEINVSHGEIHHYSINDWENIEEAKAVSLKIDKDMDGDVDFNIELEDQMTGEEIQVIIKNLGKSSSTFFTTSMIVLIVGFVGLTGFGLFFGGTEVGKLALLAIILPLYTRIKKEEVLDNEIRGMIRGYIIANPGDNYNSIKRALGLNNGALAYHLKVLEKAKIIKSRQNGMYKRFYPASMKIPHENGMQISEIQKLVLAKVKESPGISQKEIARLLGLSKGVINYHVKVLFSKNMLRMEKRGRRTQCYVNSHIIDDIKNIEKVN